MTEVRMDPAKGDLLIPHDELSEIRTIALVYEPVKNQPDVFDVLDDRNQRWLARSYSAQGTTVTFLGIKRLNARP